MSVHIIDAVFCNLLNARINIHEYENVTNNKQIMIIYSIERNFHHVTCKFSYS